MKVTTSPEPILTTGTIPLTEIGFDFDGVIADTATTFLSIAAKEYGYNSLTKSDITNFELENCINIPSTIIQQIFTDILTDSLGTGLNPMDGAIDVLHRFALHSPVTIITARPIDQPVHDWLETYFSPAALNNFRVVATGDHNDKIRHIHANEIKYFIDDRVATCLSLAEENIQPIVYNQPWNEGRHELSSVSDWEEIANLVTIPR